MDGGLRIIDAFDQMLLKSTESSYSKAKQWDLSRYQAL